MNTVQDDQKQYLDGCLRYIRTGGGISFVELVRELALLGLDTSGTWSLSLPERPNTVLWASLSEAACDVLAALLQHPDVQPMKASPLVYFYDGGALDLPIAKRLGPKDYVHPHWLPTVFNARIARTSLRDRVRRTDRQQEVA